MDNHEEEKEPLIEKSHAAGGGANLTAANTRDKQAAMDGNGITFDGKTYNVGGRKFTEYRYALKSINVNPKQASGSTGVFKTVFFVLLFAIALVFAFSGGIAPILFGLLLLVIFTPLRPILLGAIIALLRYKD